MINREPLEVWRKNLYILFLVNLLTILGHSLLVPFLALYIDEMGASSRSTEFWVGMAFAGHACAIGIASPFWGALSDRVGRKIMAQRATIGGALVLSLLALAQTPLQVVLLRIGHGAITGIVPSSNALVSASVPSERRGQSMGMLNAAMWIGGSTGPLIGSLIINTFGFSAVFYSTATCLLVSGLCVTLFIDEDFKPSYEERVDWRATIMKWRNILVSQDLLKIYSISFMTRTGAGVLAPFLALFVMTILTPAETSSSITGLVIAVRSGCAAISALTMGRLGDRIGHQRMLMASLIVASTAYALAMLVTQSWQLVVISAFIGIAMGGVFPSVTTLMSQRGRNQQIGAIYGINHSVSGGARMIASLLGIAVISVLGLRSIFGVVSILFGVAALMTATSRLEARA